MKLFDKCQECKKKNIFVKKRKLDISNVGIITSKSPICLSCYRRIKASIK